MFLDLYTITLLMTPNILFAVEYAFTHWSDALKSTDIMTTFIRQKCQRERETDKTDMYNI